MSEHAVVIAGGGPTGMMLAAELTLAGTDVLIVERRASFKLESSRSRGLPPPPHRGTLQRSARRHHGCAGPARVRGSLPRGGEGGAGAGFRGTPEEHQPLPPPPQL